MKKGREQSLSYVDVVIPLPLPKMLSYRLPEEYREVAVSGMRALVPVGKSKIYTGIIFSVHQHTPEFETRDILSLLDEYPVVTEIQMKLWEWIGWYYLCTFGDVMKSALPSGLKIESESVVMALPPAEEPPELTEKETMVYDLVCANPGIKVEKLRQLAREINALQVIKTLAEKKVIAVEENLLEKYSPKYEKFIGLNPDIDSSEQLNLIFQNLARAPKQSDVLLVYCSLARPLEKKGQKNVSRSLLLKKVPEAAAALKSLIEKEILVEYEVEVDRIQKGEMELRDAWPLNEIQEKALEEIRSQFYKKDVVLLHGVTSSGKTEIYIHLMNEVIKTGGTVLYLLPEIALTSQIINRLRAVFGNRVGIYHSRFSDAERVETYLKVLKDEDYDIILGVRSSVFLPFRRLRLIIADEEHENTYKQYDPAPRYHCRDTAMMLARLHHAKVLLGTATPSLETYYNVKQDRYGLVELFTRYKEILMPVVEIVNIKTETERKRMHGHFSQVLLEAINETIQNREQVILFQNRRGFSPFIECHICNHVPECVSCDVRLTYHKLHRKLMCHYCGYEIPVPASCPNCGSTEIETKGFGTEKIEDDLKLLIPDVRIARLDLDTARTRKAAEAIIHDFAAGKTDVLTGTQMISKGLDFSNVGLVGIMNADNMLGFPDFRAAERSFQLMVQVSGRAGRSHKQGRVIIQSRQPEHEVLQWIKENDFQTFFNNELLHREEFHYPPFTRIIHLEVRHIKPEKAKHAAEKLAAVLRNSFGNRLLGPEEPAIARVKNLYIRRILIKADRNTDAVKARIAIAEAIEFIRSAEGYKGVIVSADVDPM